MVTVLLPVHNAAGYLEQAVTSVLNQSFTRFECLIIDDGSTDATPLVVKRFADPRIRYLRLETRKGIGHCLNLGLRQARYPLIARQDADDWSHPRRLEYQVTFLKQHPRCVIVGTHGYAVDERGRRFAYLYKPVQWLGLRWYQCFESPFLHTSVLFRREVVLREMGGYPQCRHCEDIALWTRLVLHHPGANLPRPLVNHRIHAQSVIGRITRSQADRLLEKSVLPLLIPYVQTLFEAPIPREWIRVLASAPRRVGPNSPQAFWYHFRELLMRFYHRFPEARTSVAFQEDLVYQLAKYIRQVPGRPELGVLPFFLWCILKRPYRSLRLLSRKGFSALHFRRVRWPHFW